jgi:hypothetical protein
MRGYKKLFKLFSVHFTPPNKWFINKIDTALVRDFNLGKSVSGTPGIYVTSNKIIDEGYDCKSERTVGTVIKECVWRRHRHSDVQEVIRRYASICSNGFRLHTALSTGCGFKQFHLRLWMSGWNIFVTPLSYEKLSSSYLPFGQVKVIVI